MLQNGRLFVFEGTDGVGKSSLASAVHKRLQQLGIPSTLISLPGSTSGSLGKHVYEVHHDPEAFNIDSIDPTSLQVLHLAAHIDCLNSQIKPALEQGLSVVLDRYWWSAIAYGLAMAACPATLDLLERIERLHWASAEPDMLFLVNRPRPYPDAIESRLNQGYNRIFDNQLDHFSKARITNDSTLSACINVVMQNVLHYFQPSSVR